MSSPSEYQALWDDRYATLISSGMEEDRARWLATEAAAAAMLLQAREALGGNPPPLGEGLSGSRVSAVWKPKRRPGLKAAKMDGTSMVVFGAIGAVISVYTASPSGILTSLAVLGTGIAELRGNALYQVRDPKAGRYLILSQLGLIVAVWAYALMKLRDPSDPDTVAMLKEMGRSAEDAQAVAGMTTRLVAFAIMGVTLLYQGGLALWYFRKCRKD